MMVFTEIRELRELRVRMLELIIDDLRKVADGMYVYNLLKDMANNILQEILDPEEPDIEISDEESLKEPGVYEDLSRLFSDILGKDSKITVTDVKPLDKTETEELEERIRTNLKKSLEEKYDIEKMIEKAKEEIDYLEKAN